MAGCITGELKDSLPNTAIDTFLNHWLKKKGKEAVGIILSGTGTTVQKALKRSKERGGVIIVQDPMTAAFDGMPTDAINSGFADMVLPAGMMADELISFSAGIRWMIHDWKTPLNEATLMNIVQLINKSTISILVIIRDHHYRRLAAMAEKILQNLKDYFNYYSDHPDEIKQVSRGFLNQRKNSTAQGSI